MAAEEMTGILPLRLHHIGFVVRDMETSIQGFTYSLAARWDGHTYCDPIQRVRVSFLSTGPSDAQIELVEPGTTDSPVSKFLERGGGLHHVCYEVADLEQALLTLKAKKAITVRRPVPAVAFAGRRIAWALTAEKLLVELLEKECTARSESRVA